MLSPYQLAIRQQGLTGSEIAAVCGLYPWAQPIDVYAHKIHREPALDWQSNDGLIRGTLFEEPVRRWYEIKTERKVLPPADWAVAETDTLIHPDYPIVIATPDGISCGQRGDDLVLEIKCPGWRMGADWGCEGTDEIPDYYRPQVIWEMAVTGLRAAHVVAYLGDAPKIYTVPWDQDLFDALYECAQRFWNDHILSRVPPPVDGTPAYQQWIARQWPANTRPTLRPMDDTIAPWVLRLRRLHRLAGRIEKAALECREHIELFIGDHAGLDCGALGRIDWKKNKDSEKVDWKQLCTDHLPAQDLTPYTKSSRGARPFTPRFKDQ